MPETFKVGNKILNGVDVAVQDQTTLPIDFFFSMANGATTLTADTVINSNVISVASVADISIGDYLVLSFTPGDDTEQVMFSEVVSIATLDVTIDSPINYIYTSGSPVLSRTRDMNVLGTPASPKIFSIRGSDDPGFIAEIDITRLLMECLTDTVVSLAKFGDLTRLTNGLVLRRVNGSQDNIFNAKSNGELANLAYDWEPYSTINPQQGQNGFLWRYSFGGPDKHGVVIRLGRGESLELYIQDDLTALDKFRAIAAGHVVAPGEDAE